MLNTTSNAVLDCAQEFYPELTVVSENDHSSLVEEFLMISLSEEKNNIIPMHIWEADSLDENHEWLIKEFLML